jgi:hypothetical protein
MRGTSALCVASSLEGVWSNFEFIQNKRRSRLIVKRANALVSIFSTKHLVRKMARDAAQPPGSIPWQWFDAEGEEEEQAEEDEAMEVEDQEGDEDQEGESTP